MLWARNVTCVGGKKMVTRATQGVENHHVKPVSILTYTPSQIEVTDSIFKKKIILKNTFTPKERQLGPNQSKHHVPHGTRCGPALLLNP